MTREALREAGLQRRDLRRVGLHGLFVVLNQHRALAGDHLEGDDLALEGAALGRCLGAGEEPMGELVHGLAGELVLLGVSSAKEPNQPAGS